MNITFKTFFLIALLMPSFCFSQDGVIVLSKDFEEHKITSGGSVWRDDSGKSTIGEVLKSDKKQFSPTDQINILTGNVKHRGWVKFEIKSTIKQEVLIEIQNPVLDNLNIYQVADNQVITKFENLQKTTPIEKRSFRSRTFVEKINLEANQKYTIYLSHDIGYSISPIPIKFWKESAFLAHQESQKQFQGIFYGILILITIACLLVGILLKIRLFTIFGLNVLAMILSFLYVGGVLYQTLPAVLISNRIFSLDLLIVFCPFLIHVFFIRGLTRLDESRFRYIRLLYKFVIGFLIVYFIFTIFLPIWIPNSSHFLLNSIHNLAVLVFPITLFYFLFAIFSSLQRGPFVKFYLTASFIFVLIILLFFFNNGLFLNSPFISYNFLQISVLLILLILFIGLLFQIRECFTATKENQTAAETNVEIRGEEKILIREEKQNADNQVLTKRELEIIKAFANGFTHQEIAEAMFISPHTAKTHLKNIYQKLNINSKVEAVRWVMENEI